MESRFRQFLSSKRDKQNKSSETPDVQSVSYQSTSSTQRSPVFIYQPLSLNHAEEQKQNGGFDFGIPSVAYNQVPTAKAPAIIAQPHRGNGPIKLQASLISNSGERTTQTPEETLDDIRGGEYIIGRKNRRPSRSKPSRSASSNSVARTSTTESIRFNNSARVSTASPTSPPWPLTPIVGHQTDPEIHLPTHLVDEIPPLPLKWMRIHEALAESASGLNIAATSSMPKKAYPMTQGENIHETPGNVNLTVKALWKAEHSQLAKLYGQDGMERRTINPGRDRSISLASTLPRKPTYSLNLFPDPLPHSQPDNQGDGSKRGSGLSRTSVSILDDSSDGFSYSRSSLMSSGTVSSGYTASTSVTDHESVTTREEIRRVIEDMRSAYLHALDVQTPSRSKSKVKKKKQKSTPTNLPDMSKVEPTHLSLSCSPKIDGSCLKPRRNSISSKSLRRIRVDSQPVAGVGSVYPFTESLSPPSEGDNQTTDLKRADSTTLGSSSTKLSLSKYRRQATVDSKSGQAQEHDNQWTSYKKSTFSQAPCVQNTNFPDNTQTSISPNDGVSEILANIDTLYFDLLGYSLPTTSLGTTTSTSELSAGLGLLDVSMALADATGR